MVDYSQVSNKVNKILDESATVDESVYEKLLQTLDQDIRFYESKQKEVSRELEVLHQQEQEAAFNAKKSLSEA